METIRQYHDAVSSLIDRIMNEQASKITEAASLVADAVQDDKIFHVFGSGGHSNMVAIEMCHRAGNLIPCNAILDPGLSCEHGATRWCEKVQGYAQNVLRYYRVKQGDVMIQFNAYGINTCSIDTATECRRLGVKLIAVTSPSLSRSIPEDFPGRHPSRQNLCDLADVVIDSYTPYGEAVVELEGYPFKVSPASTIANLFIMNSINAKTCEILAERGVKPPVWISGNVPGGTESNQAGMDKYFGILRHL
ncbi:MAG: SIS domain-containing protein [Spirochaetales bacterium]|nr:SIS domain-containing protein [Spirochaetales bacterium]